MIQIGTVGLLLTFLYCGSDWRPEPSFVAWARKLPEGPVQEIAVKTAENLRIFSNAGNGLARQVTHNIRGHGSYLLGREHHRALWYYFPVLMAIKLSLPLLLAPLLLAAVRPRVLLNWACVAAAALVLFSVACRVQIGIRFMLPLMTLAVVGLSSAAVAAWHTAKIGWRRNLGVAGLSAGVLWSAGIAVTAWPHGLCYINELWGGTSRGYRLVSDANYDWGQGLKELLAWQRRHELPTLAIWYFGTDPAVLSPPLEYLPLHVLPIEKPEDVRALVRGRYLAVSTSLLFGAKHERKALRCAADYLLQNCQPVDRTTTFFIYDFTESQKPGFSKKSGF